MKVYVVKNGCTVTKPSENAVQVCINNMFSDRHTATRKSARRCRKKIPAHKQLIIPDSDCSRAKSSDS